MTITSNIDTADHVLHGPTGETWVVARVDGEHLHACGWPPTVEALADCTLTRKASAAERLQLLRDLATGAGPHSAWAGDTLLAAAAAESLDTSETEAVELVGDGRSQSLPPVADGVQVAPGIAWAGGEASGQWDREDVEAVIACLGDDAAQLRADNDEDERAANADQAASMLTWMVQTHPAFNGRKKPVPISYGTVFNAADPAVEAAPTAAAGERPCCTGMATAGLNK